MVREHCRYEYQPFGNHGESRQSSPNIRFENNVFSFIQIKGYLIQEQLLLESFENADVVTAQAEAQLNRFVRITTIPSIQKDCFLANVLSHASLTAKY
jgi:hypothetical protein